MNYLLGLLLLISYGCCHKIAKQSVSTNNIDSDLNTNLYKIEKIDSLSQFYVIYSSKGIQRFKILSNISNEDSLLPKIKLGSRYDLTLFSILKDVRINNVRLPTFHKVDCVGLNDSLNICIEPQNFIYDIYRTKNLKGLYYFPNSAIGAIDSM